jgi:hypothetical protein
MDTVVSAWGGRGPRGSQDETSPFPLEFMVARPLGQSQDETSPFPLDFVVVARKRRASHDETSPFLLEYQVTPLEVDDGAVRLQRSEPPLVRGDVARQPERSQAERQPRRTVSAFEAAPQLRDYAARVAAGEALPPYRGPILAGEVRARASLEREPAGHDCAGPSSDAGKAIVKLALGVMLMMAALVAAAVGGDDATLRSAGAAIGGWFTGNDGSFERFPLEAATCPCNERPHGASQKP